MSLSLPAGPDARRRPSHLKGFLRLLPFLLAAMGLAWLALDGLVFRESARHMRDLERVSAIHRNYREAYFAAKSNIWAGVNAFLDRTIGETQDTFDDTTKKTIRSVAVAPALPSPDSPASTPSTPSTSSTPSTASHPLRSALVVDDVPVNLLVEQAMLKRAGVAEVVTAPSGTAALEALEKHGAFDLVLTDLWMPEMDGYALCAHLRADERWRKLPVYAVTADVEARKVAAERGFDGLLLKPVTIESLSGFLGSFRDPAGS